MKTMLKKFQELELEDSYLSFIKVTINKDEVYLKFIIGLDEQMNEEVCVLRFIQVKEIVFPKKKYSFNDQLLGFDVNERKIDNKIYYEFKLNLGGGDGDEFISELLIIAKNFEVVEEIKEII